MHYLLLLSCIKAFVYYFHLNDPKKINLARIFHIHKHNYYECLSETSFPESREILKIASETM